MKETSLNSIVDCNHIFQPGDLVICNETGAFKGIIAVVSDDGNYVEINDNGHTWYNDIMWTPIPKGTTITITV